MEAHRQPENRLKGFLPTSRGTSRARSRANPHRIKRNGYRHGNRTTGHSVYANDNPIQNTDPTGMTCMRDADPCRHTRYIHKGDSDEQKRRVRQERDRQGSAGGTNMSGTPQGINDGPIESVYPSTYFVGGPELAGLGKLGAVAGGRVLSWIERLLLRRGVVVEEAAKIGPKIAKQIGPRGWTREAIDEAMKSGKQVRAVNKATGNAATRYIHPTTGQSVVVDDVTEEVIHVGGPGFKYGAGSGDLP